MAPDGVACLAHAMKQSLVGLGMAANDKERGGHLTFLKAGQHPGGDVGMGAVVKGQVHLL
jgi:hypothetical protein